MIAITQDKKTGNHTCISISPAPPDKIPTKKPTDGKDQLALVKSGAFFEK